MKKIIILIWGILLSLSIKAQTVGSEYKISLVNTVNTAGVGEIIFPDVTKEVSFLKNVPKIECDTTAIFYFKVNRYLSKDSISNLVHLFVGINREKRQKYVVIDTDRNSDFGNNALLTFAYPDTSLRKGDFFKSREKILQNFIGLQIPLDSENEDFAHIGVDPYGYWSPNLAELEVLITYGDYMKTNTMLGELPITLFGTLDANYAKKNMTSFTISYKDKSDSLVYKSFKKGDTIQVRDKLYQLTQIEHPDMTLKYIGTLADSSNVGSFIPTLYAKELKGDTKVRLNELLKGKYVFIDFWGSWCGWCIACTPELKVFYDKIKHRKDVIMLGLALENKADLKKLDGIIKEKGIKWENYWLDAKESEPLTSTIKKLDIHSYPTYLLIDNTGKIVFKGKSSFQTQEAIDFFLKMID